NAFGFRVGYLAIMLFSVGEIVDLLRYVSEQLFPLVIFLGNARLTKGIHFISTKGAKNALESRLYSCSVFWCPVLVHDTKLGVLVVKGNRDVLPCTHNLT